MTAAALASLRYNISNAVSALALNLRLCSRTYCRSGEERLKVKIFRMSSLGRSEIDFRILLTGNRWGIGYLADDLIVSVSIYAFR